METYVPPPSSSSDQASSPSDSDQDGGDQSKKKKRKKPSSPSKVCSYFIQFLYDIFDSFVCFCDIYFGDRRRSKNMRI